MKKTAMLSGNAALPHQVRIAYLITNLNNHLANKGAKFHGYIATPETKVIIGGSRLEPDILVFHLFGEQNPTSKIWIEVCKRTPSIIAADKAKIQKAFRSLKGLEEGFVYDYQFDKWYRYNRHEHGFTVNSKSEWLGLDLSKLISSVLS